MKHINDEKLKKKYIDYHKINTLFSSDVMSVSELVSFAKNEFLIKQGIRCDYLYILVDGEVRYYSYNDKGVIFHIGATQNFGFFGEAASLWNNIPENNVQATRNSTVLRISLMQYRDLLLNDVAFLRYISSLMAERLRRVDNNIASYAFTNSETRLVTYLLEINKNGEIPYSLKYISEIISISYRQTLRIMNLLVQNGYLAKNGTHYKIINYKGLYALSTDNYQYFD